MRLRSYLTVHQMVSRYIKSDALRTVLSFHPLLVGGNPFKTTSIYALILYLEQKWGVWYAMGGTGAISEAIAGAAREAGVEIRTETPVSRILVKDGAVVGVVLENGDYFTANVVASSLDPRQTFSKLVGEEHLPADFVEDVKRYKYRGSSGKVNLSLDGLPDFTCLPAALWILSREGRTLRHFTDREGCA